MSNKIEARQIALFIEDTNGRQIRVMVPAETVEKALTAPARSYVLPRKPVRREMFLTRVQVG